MIYILIIKSKGDLIMILSYLKIEFKVILCKKIILILFILFFVIFYILFILILNLLEDVKFKFYKEYMYSMMVYSLLSFSLLIFLLDIINEK